MRSLNLPPILLLWFFVAVTGGVSAAGTLPVKTPPARSIALSTGSHNRLAATTVKAAQARATDKDPAASAALNAPEGVATDRYGNVFVADTRNEQIRRVDASSGAITTVAGDGTICADAAAACGDGGPATAAQLDEPISVAVDGAGNLFIADSQDQRIRRVDARSGAISTIAGDGSVCSLPAPTSCGDGGPATAAQLSFPEAVAADGSGDVFIADTFDNRVRKVDSSGRISTIAGTGKAGYAGDGGPAASAELAAPAGIAVDEKGGVYIADTGNYRIRKIWGGKIFTIAGDGAPGTAGVGAPATAAQLSFPEGIALDPAGDIFIADVFANRIERVDARTHVLTVVAGDGALCLEGTVSCGDGGPATNAYLDSPSDVTVGKFGAIFVADTEDNRIRRIDPRTKEISTAAGTGVPGLATGASESAQG